MKTAGAYHMFLAAGQGRIPVWHAVPPTCLGDQY
jgi:hypothetical protein